MKNELKEFFWYDLCAEYDAIHLYRELHASRSHYSEDFLNFLEMWYADEQNHAAGFYELYKLLYDVNDEFIKQELQARTADFSEMREFLEDEFKLCVLFAYDEFASVMTYKKDLFYHEFGLLEFVTWIRNVLSDEALHFGNLVRLIRFKYLHRLHETREILLKIAEIEQQRKPYQATFLFDHECPHFLLTQEELAGRCINTVLQKIMNDKSLVM
ncbi:MAG: hypothetical protein A3F11_11570 [Gammaproteobacteria bacterium RIFCSPHIGHO2_12_FULL_37_14]|nr:MAG: hypothetical protein A3F11_11570 [Gammaproteobacteria bacterium RIFCSPHIGHO2_12_FULL_37_14]